MKRHIAILAVGIILVGGLAPVAEATNPDPNRVWPWEYRTESPLGDDGGWIIPPSEFDGSLASHLTGYPATYVIWIGQTITINCFLEMGEIENATENNEPTEVDRPVVSR